VSPQNSPLHVITSCGVSRRGEVAAGRGSGQMGRNQSQCSEPHGDRLDQDLRFHRHFPGHPLQIYYVLRVVDENDQIDDWLNAGQQEHDPEFVVDTESEHPNS
jgi:hypothetical protein